VERCLESMSSTESLPVIESNFLFRYLKSSMVVDLQAVTSSGCLCRPLFMVVSSALTGISAEEDADWT
jgi:hypothetical protein